MNRYSEMDDRTLVDLTLLGNDDAFGELVTRYRKLVVGTAYKVTNSRHTAEDASQDAFVAAWINLSGLRERGQFRSWVCAIAHNHALDLAARYRRAMPDISLDLVSYKATDGENDEIAALIASLDSKDGVTDDRLRAALDSLSEKVRETVRLHYFEDMSVAEIAEKLGVPEGTVKWRLSEGRKKLRKEYGIMEKTYDENESIVRRVLDQVEHLKLWRLRGDKSGFEAEYRAVLALAESLGDGKDKSHAMADILMLGYWWLPGEKNDEVLARIRAEAEAGHNDDVMQAVIEAKVRKFNYWQYDERKKLLNDEIIPYLTERDFPKSLGYARCLLAQCEMKTYHPDRGIEALMDALTTLTEKDEYYHVAKDFLALYDCRADVVAPHGNYLLMSNCRSVKLIDGKYYFWQEGDLALENGDWSFRQPYAILGETIDGLIVDPGMKAGERLTKKKNGGDATLECIADDADITTPAGRFEKCRVYVYKAEFQNGYSFKYESAFCPGVGQIAYRDSYSDAEWLLSSYDVHGEGLIPLENGNRWSYVCTDPEADGMTREYESRFEVKYRDGDSALVGSTFFKRRTGYTDTWLGNIVSARYDYNEEDENGERACDVSDRYARAAELAATPREKAHTKVAAAVAKRIYDTDFCRRDESVESRPLNGLWNFFCYLRLKQKDNGIYYDSDRDFGFEWKCPGIGGRNGNYILNNFFFEIIGDVTFDNKLWSDEWKDGYHTEGKRSENGFDVNDERAETVNHTLDVRDAGTVEVPAGRFDGCLCVGIWSDIGHGRDYMSGKKEYYYAPGIGIVKFVTYWEDEPLEYVLTEYSGEGEGYFPIADGLFRRYEPTSIGEGCEASVELTYSVEGEDAVVLVDQLGTQSRTWTGEAEAKASQD